MADKRVALCLLWHKGKLLLYLRDDKPWIAHPNHWALLGGGIMDGESPLDAVEREIEEESGKPASGLRYCGELVVANQVLCHDHTIYLFEGDMTFGLDELHLTEGQRLELFYFEEFLQLKFADFLKDFIVDHMRMTNQLP